MPTIYQKIIICLLKYNQNNQMYYFLLYQVLFVLIDNSLSKDGSLYFAIEVG